MFGFLHRVSQEPPHSPPIRPAGKVLGDDRLFNRWFSSLPGQTNLFRVFQRKGHCAVKDLHELTSSEHGQLWREYRLVPRE